MRQAGPQIADKMGCNNLLKKGGDKLKITSYFKWFIKSVRNLHGKACDAEIPILEQSTPIQKLLICAVISGNIRKVS